MLKKPVTLAEETIALLNRLLSWQDGIEEALHHAKDSHTFDDIVGMVVTNRAQFLEYPDFMCIMQIVQFPQFSTYHIFMAAGNMEAMLLRKDDFKNAALAAGCKYLSFAGRKGWLKVLEREGWEPVLHTMYLEV